MNNYDRNNLLAHVRMLDAAAIEDGIDFWLDAELNGADEEHCQDRRAVYTQVRNEKSSARAVST